MTGRGLADLINKRNVISICRHPKCMCILIPTGKIKIENTVGRVFIYVGSKM
jgi:hypothetical protein